MFEKIISCPAFDQAAFAKKELPLPTSPRLNNGIRPFEKVTTSLRFRWVLLVVFIMTIILWRNTIITSQLGKERDMERVVEIISDMRMKVDIKSNEAEKAKENAKYWEGVVDGMNSPTEGIKRREKGERVQQTREKITQTAEYVDEVTQNEHSVEEVLENIKKDVEESVKSTIDTMKNVLSSEGVSITTEDKTEAAEELLKTAVALELAANSLSEEAREIVGEKEAIKLIDEVVEAEITEEQE